MTATPDGGRTLQESSKSNLALTKSESSGDDVERAASVEKSPQISSPPPFPEGGLQAWLTVLGGSVSSSYHIVRYPLSPVFTQVHDTLLHLRHGPVIWCLPGILFSKRFPQSTHNSPHCSPQSQYLSHYASSDISWIGSVQTFLLFAGGLPAGKLFDEGLVSLFLHSHLVSNQIL